MKMDTHFLLMNAANYIKKFGHKSVYFIHLIVEAIDEFIKIHPSDEIM
jgi:hypothetical protein